MNLKKLLQLSTGLLFTAGAASAAFADDVEAGAAADAQVDPNAGGGAVGMDATGTATGEPVAAVTGFVHPSAVIDRALTINQGKIAAEAALVIARVSITIAGMTESSTGQALLLGGTYGVTDKIHAGAYYGFSLNEFEIKGQLTPYAAMQLMHDDKLDVAAGANLSIDLNGQGVDAMGMPTSEVFFGLQAGLAVRYKVAPKIAVFTGNPFQLGPAGTHLNLGLSGDETKSFDIPVGAGFQATPELFAYMQTNLATILISDPGPMGSRLNSIVDFTPLTLGAFYAVNNNIDATVNFGLPDVQGGLDAFAISIGARYYQ